MFTCQKFIIFLFIGLKELFCETAHYVRQLFAGGVAVILHATEILHATKTRHVSCLWLELNFLIFNIALSLLGQGI